MFQNIENQLRQIYGNDIGIHHSRSTIQNIHTEIGSESSKVDIVVVIHEIFNIAMVWNIRARRAEKCINSTLTYSKSWKALKCHNHEILTIYKTFKVNGSNFYEKVIVLDIDTLFELSACLPELLEFDSDDNGYPTTNKNDVAIEDKLRTKNTTSRWNRDRKFSKVVLEAYNYQCAICRCNIPQLLEAAHERGYEVCNTSIDTVEHGICLCRNHHAMYDKPIDENKSMFLLDIDLEKCTIQINDNRITQMPWYKEFLKTYDGKILPRFQKR